MEMIVTLIRLVYHDATLVRLELKNTDAILLDVLHHMMFIENSFQTTELTWILSLGKKLSLQLRKNRFAMEKTKHMDFMPSGRRFKEHRAARWMKRIISFLLREHATVFY